MFDFKVFESPSGNTKAILNGFDITYYTTFYCGKYRVSVMTGEEKKALQPALDYLMEKKLSNDLSEFAINLNYPEPWKYKKNDVVIHSDGRWFFVGETPDSKQQLFNGNVYYKIWSLSDGVSTAISAEHLESKVFSSPEAED